MRADRLALLGPTGSGKSTIAAEWAKLRFKIDGHTAKSLSFAGPLKAEVARALAPLIIDARGRPRNGAERWLLVQFADPKTKDRWRGILQWWGTEFRRADREDYWVQQTVEAIDRFEDLGDRGHPRSIVVDDCRFPDEYAMLRERGFTFVRLTTGATVRQQTEGKDTHASEQHWERWGVDLELSYEPGPEKQAKRIIALLAEGATSV